MHLLGRSFYKKLKYPEAINVKNITDERPSSVLDHRRVTFREHFTFEDGFKNSAPGRKDVEYSIPEHGGTSINTCGGGNKCLGGLLRRPAFSSKTSKA